MISGFGLLYERPHNELAIASTHDGELWTLSDEARRRGLYLIGQTGSGKTTLAANLVAQDLVAGRGVIVIDPLGGFADTVLGLVPKHRFDQVCILDPADYEFPVGFNLLDGAHVTMHATIADDVVSAFVHIFGRDAVGDRSQQVLRNAVRALLYHPGTTLLGVSRLLNDDAYRARIVRGVRDPLVAAYWRQQFDAYDPRYRDSVIGPIQNKLDALLSSSALRNILGQPRSSIDFRRAMDEEHILIVPLRKASIGEINARVLGALLITKLTQVGFSRADVAEEARRPVYLFADEFQDFASTSFARLLSQARQFRIATTLSHQHLSQLSDELRDAVFGNVGSMVALRVGAADSDILAAQIGIEPETELAGLGSYTRAPDHLLTTLPNFEAYARLLIQGTPTPALRLSLPPPPRALHHRTHRVIAASRAQFGRSRAAVEAGINRFLGAGAMTAKARNSHRSA